MARADNSTGIWRGALLPYDLRNKIFFSKDFVTEFFQVVHLSIINGDKDHPVIPQQIRRQAQAGIHHIQPVGVEPAHGLRVGLGGLGGDLPVPGQGVGEVVGVDEIVPRVVGRVDVIIFTLR